MELIQNPLYTTPQKLGSERRYAGTRYTRLFKSYLSAKNESESSRSCFVGNATLRTLVRNVPCVSKTVTFIISAILCLTFMTTAKSQAKCFGNTVDSFLLLEVNSVKRKPLRDLFLRKQDVNIMPFCFAF